MLLRAGWAVLRARDNKEGHWVVLTDSAIRPQGPPSRFSMIDYERAPGLGNQPPPRHPSDHVQQLTGYGVDDAQSILRQSDLAEDLGLGMISAVWPGSRGPVASAVLLKAICLS